jgi:hypothetical protein
VHYGFVHPAGTVTGTCWVMSGLRVPVCVPDPITTAGAATDVTSTGAAHAAPLVPVRRLMP